jgi:hypothetical protein
MRRGGIVLLVVLAGCGSSGIEGTLGWQGSPTIAAHRAGGVIENKTSHAVSVKPRSMRLLDARGKKVAARIRVDRSELQKGGSTRLEATWKSGVPVRIDYGSGTLALPSD